MHSDHQEFFEIYEKPHLQTGESEHDEELEENYLVPWRRITSFEIDDQKSPVQHPQRWTNPILGLI